MLGAVAYPYPFPSPTSTSAATTTHATASASTASPAPTTLLQAVNSLQLEQPAAVSTGVAAAKKRRRELRGTTVLLGHLYRHGLMPENIVHMCLSRLLEEAADATAQRAHSSPAAAAAAAAGTVDESEDEDGDSGDEADPVVLAEAGLDAVVDLLEAVGEQLDAASPASRAAVDDYMAHMRGMASASLLSTRMRFRVMGITEQRAASWVPRTEAEVNPKPLVAHALESRKAARYWYLVVGIAHCCDTRSPLLRALEQAHQPTASQWPPSIPPQQT